MKRSLAPPGRTETVRAERVLVLAPHADDEVFGCGGLLHQLAEQKASIEVLILSDGAGGIEGTPDDSQEPCDVPGAAERRARGAEEIAPSTVAWRAPVTAGLFPGSPASVRDASHAKAAASTQSGATP